jgi:hypothetical protein
MSTVTLLALLVASGYRMEWLRYQRDEARFEVVVKAGRVRHLGKVIDRGAEVIRGQKSKIAELTETHASAAVEASVMRAHARETAVQMDLLEAECARVVTDSSRVTVEAMSLMSRHLVEVAP